MKARFLLSNLALSLIVVLGFTLTGCQEELQLQQITVTKVTTETADETNALSAKCEINITEKGTSPVLERGVIYDSKDWNNQKIVKASTSSTGSYKIELKNLLPGSIYGVRGYYRTEKGVVYSSVAEFSTPILEGTVKDEDGNEYKTIKIGKYEWMAENLRTRKLADGGTIKYYTNKLEDQIDGQNLRLWQTLLSLGCCSYGDDLPSAKSIGLLYNGYVGNSVFITGWHVPSSGEWKALKNHLISHRYGTDKVEDNLIAKCMASDTTLWEASALVGSIGFDLDKNNTIGFNAIPAGYKLVKGDKSADKGKTARFWSSTTDGDFCYHARLSFDEIGLDLDGKDLDNNVAGLVAIAHGFSIRLVREIPSAVE